MHPLDELELRVFAMTSSTEMACKARTLIEYAIRRDVLTVADVADLLIEFQETDHG